MRLYLICSNDYLQTAFFCGTGRECCQVLGLKNMNVFYSSLSHKRNFLGFFHIEPIDLEDEDV